MNKEEFLDVLRQSLIGEVANEIITQNIKYYDGYISAQNLEEEAKIIDRLGDPRLIAKTIIEAEKAAKEKNTSNLSGREYQSYKSETYQDYRDNSTMHGKKLFFTNMKWYHKLIAALVIIVCFILVAFVGRLVIGLLFTFSLPILLILLIMLLLRKR